MLEAFTKGRLCLSKLKGWYCGGRAKRDGGMCLSQEYLKVKLSLTPLGLSPTDIGLFYNALAVARDSVRGLQFTVRGGTCFRGNT